MNTPAAEGAETAHALDQNDGDYYDSYQQPPSKRVTGGTPGCKRAVPSPYDYTSKDAAVASHEGPGGNSSGSETNIPPCQCGQPCVRRVSNTGKNPGRAFFKCPKPQGEQCNYFKWEEELGAVGAVQANKVSYGSETAGGGIYGGSGGSYSGGAPIGFGHNPYASNPYTASQAASSSVAPVNPYVSEAPGSGAYRGGAGAYGGGGVGAEGGAGLAKSAVHGSAGDEYVKCLCGIDCPVKTSNSANNPGRQFFACPKMRDVG